MFGFVLFHFKIYFHQQISENIIKIDKGFCYTLHIIGMRNILGEVLFIPDLSNIIYFIVNNLKTIQPTLYKTMYIGVLLKELLIMRVKHFPDFLKKYTRSVREYTYNSVRLYQYV